MHQCCLMDYKHGMKTWLILLLFSLLQITTASHSLQYVITATTPGRDFPEYTVVGLVDGQQIVYYDSNIRKMIPKEEWMEKNVGEDYWSSETEKQESSEEIFRTNLDILMKRFNQTEGIHTLQRRSGCELHDGGAVKGYFQFGYDGEDFLSLDLNTLSWTAANQKAVSTKQKWEAADDGHHRKNYLENDCVDFLKAYVNYGRSILERKVSPRVDLSQKDPSSPVVCHATGFFPKSVMISWQKNGEDLDEDVDLRETLLNQDGTFQKRSILTVSPEELDSDKYACVVQHSGLEKEMVLQISYPRVLSGGCSFGIITSAVVAVSLLLSIVCVGVTICYKKKSGFKPVSGNPSAYSDGDAISHHSKDLENNF